MATGGVFRYDPASRTYSLPPEHAALLTGHSARNFAPMSQILNHFGKHLPQLIHCFRQGGGVPYAAFRPEFTKVMDDTWRRIYDEHLVTGFLAAIPVIPERLALGIRVADIGCGTGHVINLMGREYPRSTFVGYDLAEDAIAQARGEAVRHALAPEGIFLMIDFKFSSSVEGNMSNPYSPLYYGISTMHCMTVSLAEGGAGLGTVWGVEVARQMLAEAGFTRIDVFDSPRPQNCIYVCRT